MSAAIHSIPQNGYIYVATVKHEYYVAAKRSAKSLLDFYPEAKITLFTIPEWVEEEDHEIFDQIRTDGPNHVRTKLWALAQTPYFKTMYIDCDTFVQHEDISKAFDYLGDNDIIFTRNRPYNSKITKLSDTEEMIYHCGIFVYRKTLHTQELFLDWFEGYKKQVSPGFDISPYPERARPWDTFTMWYLLNKTRHQQTIKVGEFPSPDARWNFCMGQKPEELMGEEIVITHYTISRINVDESHTDQ